MELTTLLTENVLHLSFVHLDFVKKVYFMLRVLNTYILPHFKEPMNGQIRS